MQNNTCHFIAFLTIPFTCDPDVFICYGKYADCFNAAIREYELSLSAAKELRRTDSVNVHYENSACFYGSGMGVTIYITECNCALYHLFGECETVQNEFPDEF